MRRPRLWFNGWFLPFLLFFQSTLANEDHEAVTVDSSPLANNYIDDTGGYSMAGGGFSFADPMNNGGADGGIDFLRGPSSKVRKEIEGAGGMVDPEAALQDDLVKECLRAVNNCTNTQDTLLIHVALFLLSDRKWRPTPNSSQVQYVLSGCEKYEKFIQCVESHTSNAVYGSQECFELSGFSDSFGFRWHRCNRFKRWVSKKPSRRHSRSRYYFRRHGRMRI